ncbi:hypothetical protein NUM3379_06350 [Kineococcus sp. NUM-3379]
MRTPLPLPDPFRDRPADHTPPATGALPPEGTGLRAAASAPPAPALQVALPAAVPALPPPAAGVDRLPPATAARKAPAWQERSGRSRIPGRAGGSAPRQYAARRH